MRSFNGRSAMLRRVTAWAMAIAMIVSHVAVVSVAAADDLTWVDYTEAQSDDRLWASPSAVLSALLGYGILRAEAEYLDAHSAYRVYYSAAAPQGSYQAYAFGEGIRVLANSYDYTTADGHVMAWEPLYATTDDDLVWLEWSEEDRAYRADLAGAAGDTVTVYYVAAVSIPADMAQGMANEAYGAAVELSGAVEDYLAEHEAWSERNAPYQIYLAEKKAYEDAELAYRTYEQELADYQAACDALDAWWTARNAQAALYEAYRVELNDYEAAERAYWDWSAHKQAYDDYMNLVAISPGLKAEYEANVTEARIQLGIIDSMYDMILMDKTCGFYELLCSETVAEILSRKDELETLGGNPQDVKAADRATKRLKELMGEYELLETEKDHYEFYLNHYVEMRTEIVSLYTALRNLGNVPSIMKQIEKEGQETKKFFAQFQAVLYQYGCLMDDDTRSDPTMTFVDWSLTELVETDLLPTDLDRATPTQTVWPEPPQTADDVDPVPYPGEAPERLTKPETVAPPADESEAPETPTEPDEVFPPEGEPPEPVAHPGEEPSYPAMDEQQEALYQAYQRGEITGRADAIQSPDIQIEHAYVTAVRAEVFCTVIIYNHRGLQLGEYHVPFGGSLTNTVIPPVVRDENRQPLPFLGWRLEGTEDTFVSLDYISSDLVLYATYGTNPPAETETESDSESESQSETCTETESMTETETVTQTDTDTETVTETELETESELVTETETESESECISDTDTEISTESDTETAEIEITDTQSSSAETDVTLDTESATDPDSETEQESGTGDTDQLSGCRGCRGCRSTADMAAMAACVTLMAVGVMKIGRKRKDADES